MHDHMLNSSHYGMTPLCFQHLCQENIHSVVLQVFYPFVLFYMVAAFLQGGAGTASNGLLNNLRQFLWIPITQDAYRSVTSYCLELLFDCVKVIP